MTRFLRFTCLACLIGVPARADGQGLRFWARAEGQLRIASETVMTVDFGHGVRLRLETQVPGGRGLCGISAPRDGFRGTASAPWSDPLPKAGSPHGGGWDVVLERRDGMPTATWLVEHHRDFPHSTPPR